LLSIQTHIDTATNQRNENEMLRKEIAIIKTDIQLMQNQIAEIQKEKLNEK